MRTSLPLLPFVLATSLQLTACTPTLHVLTSEGRPVKAYDHPLSCQFAAFHEMEKGMPEVACVEMTLGQLSSYANGKELTP
jgi:hypothetical protein